MDDNIKYRELFFEETDEHLESLNDDILRLEKEPDNRTLLDSIFRSAHTLKGMAATMGYETMATLTHKMENLFQQFKDGTLSISSETITLIFDCLDKLAEIVEGLRLKQDISEATIATLVQRLTDFDEATSQTESTVGGNPSQKEGQLSLSFINLSLSDEEIISQGIEQGYWAYGIAIRLEQECALKGPRVFLILDKLESYGEVIHSEPSPEILESGEFSGDFQLLFMSQEEPEKVTELILSNSDIEALVVEKMTNESLQDYKLKTSLESEELLVDQALESKKTMSSKLAQTTKVEANHSNQSIRVELAKLDSFMNLVSELVVYRTRLENLSSRYQTAEIKEPLDHVARITSELQDLVLKIRMQQVGIVMNRFPRVVRDLAKELDKEIELEIEGEDTELDRTVVSELSEPLIHLIRNSADHGIERPERRAELGKPKIGKIRLTASQQGNRVMISVSDDGKGLNPVLIKASAEKKGLEVEGLSEQEIMQLIFHPGFSTATEVTNVSGRGVGMDVVHSKINSLGGSIELTSEVDVGTTFAINLPLTLSIIQSLMVKVGQETFALPLGVIEKVIEIQPSEIVQVHQKEVYFYRGVATPVIRVNESLEIPEQLDNQHPHLIMVLLGKYYYALLVDELIGQQEIVIKKLGQELKTLTKYLGATILGNGDITLILDINTLCYESNGGIYV
ncbi:chemotaxis protein CheA [Vagococcus salmoninarum]|uniref:Chemotaxis protein CheA n=1 Tax=Vagococcus salmoninarum TaxID=2739 RepID=A0A429ZT40_9ENTE|nr:chemotaxis protein CheA [Vagococcus salmoninarum]RST96790.1 chemotaxis protein CheA [Vagococcus salmoninarum]